MQQCSIFYVNSRFKSCSVNEAACATLLQKLVGSLLTEISKKYTIISKLQCTDCESSYYLIIQIQVASYNSVLKLYAIVILFRLSLLISGSKYLYRFTDFRNTYFKTSFTISIEIFFHFYYKYLLTYFFDETK